MIEETIPGSRDEMVTLLRRLAHERRRGDRWENVDTVRYLEALWAYCRVLGRFPMNDAVLDANPWAHLGTAVESATVYE